MWYLAAITLASTEPQLDGSYQCEECNVLFESDSAAGAYAKAVVWAEENTGETTELLGIKHLTTVGDRLGEGVDICGRLFRAEGVWERQPEFTTPLEQLGAFFSEASMDLPLRDALGDVQAEQLMKHLKKVAPELKLDLDL